MSECPGPVPEKYLKNPDAYVGVMPAGSHCAHWQEGDGDCCRCEAAIGLIRISEDTMMEMTPTRWSVRVGGSSGVLSAPFDATGGWVLTWHSEHDEGSTGGLSMPATLTRTAATERIRQVLHALETRRMGLEAPGTAEAIIKAVAMP